MNNIIAFTDGASKGNPGPGGWGAVVVDGDHIQELGGAEKNTTNNRMEMMAALGCLEYADDKNKSATIHTDSSYLVNGITKWAAGWKANGWKTKAGGDVLNQDIWKKLLKLSGAVSVTWKLLPGHAGVPGNERADKIASGLAEGGDVLLYRGTISDYGVNVLDFSVDEKALAKKKSTSSRSGAKAYSYLSMVKGKIEKHATWAECEKRVKGVKGARYRKTLSQEEEREIINEWTNLSRQNNK